MGRYGLHLRLQGTLTDLAKTALALRTNFFQCFFVRQGSGRLVDFKQKDVDSFLALRDQFTDLYLHGSYWSNLSGLNVRSHPSLEREVAIAQRLKFTHVVLHAGSAKGGRSTKEGVHALAATLNYFCQRDDTLTFVLENTAHGGLSVGSDLRDFGLLRTLLDYPDRIKFCIDTSHAYAYGYDITTIEGQDRFIQDIEETITLERVCLIHLNDTQERMGSRIDRHAMVGDGVIGVEMLKRLICHPLLIAKPVIIEPPIISREQEVAILQEVNQWCGQ